MKTIVKSRPGLSCRKNKCIFNALNQVTMKKAIRPLFFIFLLLVSNYHSYCWGFYAHKKINYFAVFLLPPEMMVLYKPNIDFIMEHAVDPDMRRYAVAQEGPRHYIDIDHYGKYPYDSLPRKWNDAVAKYSED